MGLTIAAKDKKQRELLLHGNILRGVLSVCVPMAAFQFINELFRVFDLSITAHISPESVAAVSFFNQLANTVASAGMGLSIGAGILIAGFYGAGEYQKVKQTVNTTVFLAVSGAVALAVLLVLCGRQVLTAANTPPELADAGWDYYRIMMVNLVFVFFNNVYIAVEKAKGSGKKILMVNLLMAGVKFSLSAVFVLVLDQGVVMVAVSTLLSNLLVSVIGWWSLSGKEKVFGLSRSAICLQLPFIRRILLISLPVIAEKCSFSVGKVMVNSMAVAYGTQIIGALGVSNSISALSTVPATTIGDGGAAIVRQNVGSGQRLRALYVFRCVFVIDVVWGTLGFLCTWAFLEQILTIFAGGDAAFAQMIRQIYVLEMLSNVFLSVHGAVLALLYAFGYTRLSFCLNFARLFVFRLPVLLVLQHATELDGGTVMGIVMMLSNALTGLGALVFAVLVLRREYGRCWFSLMTQRQEKAAIR